MNYYHNLQQDALADQKGTVICPKPRRVGAFYNHDMPKTPLRLKFCEQGEGSDIKAGAELLDIIFKESYYGEDLELLHANYYQEATSPPFFHGSPPVRAANPLIQDAQFGYDEKFITPQLTHAISSSSSPCLSSQLASSASSGLSSPSSMRKGGCARMKFGLKSAAVRVVGFDCHVPAIA